MRCPWLCLKVLLGKCSKHPACRKEGRKSISTWVCPSQKYYLTSAPDRDVLMAVRNVPVFDKLVRFSAHSGHGILNFISRRSRHPGKANSSCNVGAMLLGYKSDSFKSEKMPSWFMSPNQKAQRRPSGLFANKGDQGATNLGSFSLTSRLSNLQGPPSGWSGEELGHCN